MVYSGPNSQEITFVASKFFVFYEIYTAEKK